MALSCTVTCEGGYATRRQGMLGYIQTKSGVAAQLSWGQGLCW
jgi:hypothetical protein